MRERALEAGPSLVIDVRCADPSEKARVNAFYAGEGRSVLVSDGERWVLAEVEGRMVGVLRICREEGHQVLRTVQVASSHQHRGIGKRMLACAEPLLEGSPCFCLPFSHLTHFYGRIGFEPVATATAPPHLQDRLARYRLHGPGMIVMRRP